MPAPAVKQVKAAEPKAAAPVRLASPYAYYDTDGAFKNWCAGQVITDPAEIEHLTERGAPVVPHEVAP